MSQFAAAAAEGELRREPGLLLVFSGVRYAVFNAALLTAAVPGEGGTLEERARAALRFFVTHRTRWSFWLCEGLLDWRTRMRAGQILSNAGLRLISDCSGMVATRLRPPRREMPALEYRRVEDSRTRQDFCEVTQTVFHLPPWVTQAIYGGADFWRGSLRGWVGYSGGRALCTAAVLARGGAMGVYSVATLPGYRRRGYAEAVMRHALDQARSETGLEESLLQSTPMGQSLYESMGYRTVTRVSVYVSGP